MIRWFAIFSAVLTASVADAATKEDNTNFVGDVFAVMAFCNLYDYVDQFKVGMALTELGLSSADQPKIQAARDKQWEMYKNEFKTLSEQDTFCREIKMHPFLLKVAKAKTSLPNSDTTNQATKIALFGNFLGVIQFCAYSLDPLKLENYLYQMGVTSDSVKLVYDRASRRKLELFAEYERPEKAGDICDKVRTNPSVHRLSKTPR